MLDELGGRRAWCWRTAVTKSDSDTAAAIVLQRPFLNKATDQPHRYNPLVKCLLFIIQVYPPDANVLMVARTFVNIFVRLAVAAAFDAAAFAICYLNISSMVHAFTRHCIWRCCITAGRWRPFSWPAAPTPPATLRPEATASSSQPQSVATAKVTSATSYRPVHMSNGKRHPCDRAVCFSSTQTASLRFTRQLVQLWMVRAMLSARV